jgi:hypothetical protein
MDMSRPTIYFMLVALRNEEGAVPKGMKIRNKAVEQRQR